MPIIKRKIPALMQPDGQSMWTQKVSPYDIHPTVNGEKIEVRVKKMGKIKQFFIDKNRISMGQFGADVDVGIMNPDKVDFFCTRLHLCGASQKTMIENLKRENQKQKDALVSIKKRFDEIMKDIKKMETTNPILIAHQEIEKEFAKAGVSK